MGDLISKQTVIDTLIPLLNEHGDMYFAGRIMGAVDNIPTAFDLKSVIAELKEAIKLNEHHAYISESERIKCRILRSKAEYLYGSICYENALKILNSAANAANGKIGG